jgi:gliding motility-associated-like protein
MAKINYLVKIIFISSVFIILESTQLGGGMGDYSDVVRLGWKQEKEYSMDNSFYSESFGITSIRPDKVFTPNGDGWNDYLEIQYTNPYDALVKGKIYDIKGRLVANMKKDENGLTPRLIWNGNDLNNNLVTGGLYIYQVEVSGPENKVIKGTIILVR